ncbi:MAG: PqqD family protein [Planctomycetes bacterium]|nr:PqqD family protein [Planctomycetota bacterium]
MPFTAHVKWRSEKFGAVVFDTLNEKVFVTNGIGGSILKMLADDLPESAISKRLREEYADADGDRIESEVSAFLDELRTRGLFASDARSGR